jgi:hypothetical protein
MDLSMGMGIAEDLVGLWPKKGACLPKYYSGFVDFPITAYCVLKAKTFWRPE